MENNYIIPQKLDPTISKFCLTIGLIPTSYLISLTFEEQLLYIGKFIDDKVIPALNNNAEAVAQLQAAFVDLKDYVENYFDNLDVQEEIDNKLDEMIESGYFDNLLNDYLQLFKVYNTTTELLESDETFVVGEKIKTLGYYNINDGGGAEFYVSDTANTSNIQIPLGSLYLNMIIYNQIINFRSLGAKPDNENSYSHAPVNSYMKIYTDLLENSHKKYRLYIPTGIWVFDELCVNTENFDVFGDDNFNGMLDGNETTIITCRNNQRYVWKIGDNEDFNYDVGSPNIKNIKLDNLIFSSGNYNSLGIPSTRNLISRGALYWDNCSFMTIGKIDFNYVNGIALGMTTCWEIYANILNFRAIGNHSYPVVAIDQKHLAYQVSAPNISALEINTMMFEAVNGDYFKFAIDTGFANNTFHHINVEASFLNSGEDTGTVGVMANNTSVDYEHAIFTGGQCGQLVIESMNLSNFGYRYHTLNNITYSINSIFKHTSGTYGINNGSYYRVTCNNIDYDGARQHIYIINQNDDVEISANNRIVVNNVCARSEFARQYSYPKVKVLGYNYFCINNIVPLNFGDSFQPNNIAKNLYYNCSDFSGDSSNGFNLYTTDTGAFNPLQVVSRRNLLHNFTRILNLPNFNYSKIHLRAYIPTGQTLQIFYTCGAITGNFSGVAGDNEWHWLELDFSALNIPNSNNNLYLSVAASSNALFDVFYLE